MRIVECYPNNCADEDDYIQAGHLKLVEIRKCGKGRRNFESYAITAIARAMRETALEAMCSVSAPRRIKRQVHKLEMLIFAGKTENEICQELRISRKKLINLKSLLTTQSWHMLFEEPTHSAEPFSIMDDILSSSHLDQEDKTFIQAQFDGKTNVPKLSPKKQWLHNKNLRRKLARSSYDI